MRTKRESELEFQPKLRRWYWSIRSIGQLMVVVALSGLAMAVLPDRHRPMPLAPGTRPGAVRAVQVVPRVQVPRARAVDPFLHEARPGIDDAMIVTARPGIDDAMIVGPGRMRGALAIPQPAPDESESAKALPLWRVPAIGPKR
jgi:hypothetical protein